MPINRDELLVTVFSYNRGRFLDNCVRSLEKHLPHHPVRIIDDGSDDPETVELMGRLSLKYDCHDNVYKDQSEKKTGGLAGCMNLAMELAERDGYRYVLFIQDDMQLVRPVLDGDLTNIEAYFDEIDNTIQLATTFVRRLSLKNFFEEYRVDMKAVAYIHHGELHGKSAFSDTGVFSVPAFKKCFGEFEVGEDVNSRKAHALGLVCGRSVYPFMCWLPYPSSYRGRKRSLQHRFFEYFGKSGFYPIRDMSSLEVSTFLSRNADIAPVMEDFLGAEDAPRADVWSTGGGEYNFLAYDSRIARLYRTARRLLQ